jgi:prepilin-type N-terminal cleavage/methylation domain-containing protein
MVRERAGEGGFTLVELLVSIVLLGVLMSAVLATFVASHRSAELGLSEHDSVEQSRMALNRVSRELRQALRLVRAVNPDGSAHDPNAITAVTFDADFNGDGCIDGTAFQLGATCLPANPADPERLTYCYEPQALTTGVPRLYVLAGDLPAGSLTSCPGGLPVLATRMASFQLAYRSSLYRYDTLPAAPAGPDGVTTWQELDAAPPPKGNGNGVLDTELRYIDAVVVTLAVGEGAGRDVHTQVTLRTKA